jgi:dihydroxyacid dehydratase/phosphogluconate dehydratase
LALVRTGDRIALDVKQGSLSLLVDHDELSARRSAWRSSITAPARGYERLFVEHVTQADEGIDFDFLAGCGGSAPPARRPF